MVAKIKNIDDVGQAGDYCNNYTENGIQGNFIFGHNYDSSVTPGYGGNAGLPVILAFCIFTQSANTDVTISKDDLKAQKLTVQMQPVTLKNKQLATITAPLTLMQTFENNSLPSGNNRPIIISEPVCKNDSSTCSYSSNGVVGFLYSVAVTE